MPAEKRNHFLDIDESDDDGSQGYDSEAEQLRKGASKRRKLNQDDGSDEDQLSDDEIFGDRDEDNGEEGEEVSEHDDLQKEKTARDGEGSPGKDKSKSKRVSDLPDISRPLTKKNLVASEKAVKRSGVIYISRIPPFST